MRQKIFIILIGFLIFENAFYGCTGLQKESVEKNYFDLTINLPAPDQNSISQGAALLVKEFYIDPVFDSYSFVYRMGKHEYLTDYYNEFISYPAKLITDKIAESLFASIHFIPALTKPEQDIDFRLSGKITKLYGDFQNTNDPKAIIEIRMILEKMTDTSFKAIISKTYRIEEPILSRKPDQLISGWGIGLSKIVEQFISDFQLLVP